MSQPAAAAKRSSRDAKHTYHTAVASDGPSSPRELSESFSAPGALSKSSRDAEHQSKAVATSEDPSSPGNEPSEEPSSLLCLTPASISAHPSTSCSSLACQDGKASGPDSQRDPRPCSHATTDGSPSGISAGAGGLQCDATEMASSPSPILLAQANPLLSPVAPQLQSFACGNAVPGLPPASASPQLGQQLHANTDSSSVQGVTGTSLHERGPREHHAQASKGRPATKGACADQDSGLSLHQTSDKAGPATRSTLGMGAAKKQQQQSDASGPFASFSMSSGQRSNLPSDVSDTASKALTLRPRRRHPAAKPVKPAPRKRA